MTIPSHPPDIGALLIALEAHGVEHVVIGSTAAFLHGVDLCPGDLDIAPSLAEDNLRRLARALAVIGARPDPGAPFGDWRLDAGGEHRWVPRDPRPGEREARATWRPDPLEPASFDHPFATRHGVLDVVPIVGGSFPELVTRAPVIAAFGIDVRVQSIGDLLAALTIPRRTKDTARVQALRAIQRELQGI